MTWWQDIERQHDQELIEEVEKAMSKKDQPKPPPPKPSVPICPACNLPFTQCKCRANDLRK
jgi:hypothetical protein